MSIRHQITIIVACAQDGAIGRGGDMPFRISSDLKRFKGLTMGHPIIMGRKTFESLPGALPGRTNIVVTRNETYHPVDTEVCSSLEQAIKVAEGAEGPDNIMIIGGGEIYRQALPYADTIELTEIEASYDDADTFFPPLDLKEWALRELSEWMTDERSGLRYRYMTLKKTDKPLKDKI